ncbi:MAG: hypothetical protein U0807_06590 [Candidatus Binatia bacterium]
MTTFAGYRSHGLASSSIRTLFRIKPNDTTCTFETYRRTMIDGCRPFTSPHFNLTAELLPKAIVRGCSRTATPIT